MLPWSARILRIYCAPTGIVAILRRGLRSSPEQWRQVEIDGKSSFSWQGVVQQINMIADEYRCDRIRMVLSDQFIHYRCLPWRDDLIGAREMVAFARHSFLQTYGAAAENWSVAVSDEPPGRSRIAAAMPAEALAAFDGLRGKPFKVLSVRPALSVMAALWPGRNQAGVQWLVWGDRSSLGIAVVRDAQWVWLRQRRLTGISHEEILECLEEESRLSGIELHASAVTLDTGGLDPMLAQQLSAAGFRTLGWSSEYVPDVGNSVPGFALGWMA